MAISTTAGTKFYISEETVDPDEYNEMTDSEAVTAFEALTWVEVEEIEDYGEAGDSATEVTFNSVGRRRIRKLKGSRDAGTMTVVVGRDPLDAGQIALKAAEKTDFNYGFKLEYSDARSEDYSDSVEYFGALVMSRPTNLGNAENVQRINFNLGINTAILEVVSEDISGV